MAFDLSSISKPILPVGYSFAIVDNNGEVRYHSKEKRNLNENLLEEFSDEGVGKLRGAIHGGFESEFRTEYYEHSVDVVVRPMENYDYYIVVMHNREWPQMIRSDVFIFTISMTVFFLLFSLLDIFIVVFFSSEKSYSKNESIVTSWLWPRKSSTNEYLVLNIAYIFFLAFFIWFYYSRPGVLAFLFLIFVTPPILSLFSNIVFFLKYWGPNIWYAKVKKLTMIIGAVFVLLINVIACRSLESSCFWFVTYEVYIAGIWSLILIFYILKVRSKKPIGGSSNKYKRSLYLNSYSLMVYARMIITSGIPVAFCMVSSHNYEKALAARYAQIDFINRTRNTLSKEAFFALGDTKKKNDIAYQHAIYFDNAAVANISQGRYAYDTALTEEQQLAVDLFSQMGSLVQNKYASTSLYKPSAYNGAFQFSNIFDDSRNTQGKPAGVKTSVAIDPLKQGSENRLISVHSGDFGCYQSVPPFSPCKPIWMALIVILFFSYWLLRAVIKKLFSRNIVLFDSVWHKNDKPVQILNSRPAILLIGPSFDDQKELFLKGINYEVLDFEKLNQLTNHPQKNYIVIKHIDSALFTKDDLLENLLTLRKIMIEGTCIIITATKHPLQVIANAKSSDSLLNLSITNEEEAVLTDLLAHVTVIEAPWFASNQYTLPSAAGSGDNAIYFSSDESTPVSVPDFKTALTDLIKKETKYSVFLKQLGKELLRKYDNPQIDDKDAEQLVRSDTILFEIQVAARNFFNTIWSSLSDKEKFILFDLAEDGLANTTDIHNTTKLINKGLIISEDGGLHIFSRSFRNFILASLSDEEHEKIKKVYKEKNSWGKLRTPLLVATVAILVFLSISQDEVYARVTVIFGGLTTILPLLAKTLSLFGNNNNKKEA
ncbi:hypothetical protein QEG73_02095 [Chitinophagaceae bacterium 26-R-25]|nr:hypothetical protein [Chitinophagaceae bacterium 26-R-25]